VEPKEGLVHGAETLKLIRQFRTPIAVMGASAIDEHGVSEALLHAAQVYAAMTRHADEVLIVADSSKFGNRSLQQIVEWDRNVTLITDTAPPPRIASAIRQHGGEVIWG
jgi:DeoR/GlpR family transcriptional regulator of sugar metabolism